MNNKEKFQILTERAFNDAAPTVDVAGNVMAILADRHTRPDFSDRPLMWVAALSSAVAVPAAALAAFMYIWSGPLTELAKSISWVTQ